MEEYKGNSHKMKEQKENVQVPEQKAKKVVSGSVSVKKKGAFAKLASIFIADDIGNVKEYIIKDVLIPTAKKAIDDAISEGIHMLLYKGEPRRTNVGGTRISYGGFFSQTNASQPRSSSQSANTPSEFENIVFTNRADADAVLTQLDEMMSMYGLVSVADLYDSAGMSCPYTWNSYGWRDIRSATVIRMRDGYVIKLPRPVIIK